MAARTPISFTRRSEQAVAVTPVGALAWPCKLADEILPIQSIRQEVPGG